MKILVQLLDEIAERFFGVKRRNPLQGMFGDIFKVIIVSFTANIVLVFIYVQSCTVYMIGSRKT